jgi:hypothetical protein
MSPDTLELQTLTFPECSQPSVINVAFFLAALSEFAPQYHIGEYRACWFAQAALDGFHATFGGRLHLGANIHAMGKWKAASFKYINPSASIVAEYSRQLKEYEDLSNWFLPLVVVLCSNLFSGFQDYPIRGPPT